MHSDACLNLVFFLTFFMHTCIRCAIPAENPDNPNKKDDTVEFYYFSKSLGLTLPVFDQKKCIIQVGPAENQLIDLSSLALHDGEPR